MLWDSYTIFRPSPDILHGKEFRMRELGDQSPNEGAVMSMGSILQDQDFMGDVLAFYRLVASWLLSVAYPPCHGNPSAVELPLPGPAPIEFTTLPEWFVEDIIDLLTILSRFNPPVSGVLTVDALCAGQ
eukprot:scaffold25367_cov20-Tisochrysis_lutea.AAC.1